MARSKGRERAADHMKPAPSGGDERMLLRCRACGAALTGPLTPWPDPIPPTLGSARDALPRGFFWRAPEGREFWQKAGPCVVVVNLGADAEASKQAGVPVQEIEAAVAKVQDGRPQRLTLLRV
jgi:hypothetical protein